MMRSSSSLPYTPTTPGYPPVAPRPLRPFRTHPHLDSVQTPPLPTPPRPSVFHSTSNAVYRLTTHLVPAAYPRHIPDIPLPVVPAHTPGESASQRRAKVDSLVKEAQHIQNVYAEGSLPGTPSERLLWNCLNRYVRTPPRSAIREASVTLFLAHANGFHKEASTWETMIQNLLDAPAGEIVDEVWAWDAVQHGDAAVVNASNLSGVFDWLDNSRDIANFLLHYLPDHVQAAELPTRLDRLPDAVSKARQERGYDSRKLVVVGHSFGGTTSLRAAFDFPKLFSSFVLVDPVIFRPGPIPPDPLHATVRGAFIRRNRWSSREEALTLFKRSPFFSAWHPEVLQRYVDYALIDDAEGGVVLKTSPVQEGVTFANKLPALETWVMLPELDQSIELRWVVPTPVSVSEGSISERVWRRPVNSSNAVFHFAGHLIAQEAPLELAHDISDFLLRKYCKARL